MYSNIGLSLHETVPLSISFSDSDCEFNFFLESQRVPAEDKHERFWLL